MADGAPVTAPDPNGCKRCGLADCNRESLHAAFEDTPVSPRAARKVAAEAYWKARFACESRPAVDWQAECRKRDERLAALRTPPTEEDWREIARGHRCYSCADDGGASGCHPVNCGHNARVSALRAAVEAERERTRMVVEAAAQVVAAYTVKYLTGLHTNMEALAEAVRALRGEP